MSITEQVIILFLVVLVGVVCRKLGYFNDATIHGVTQLVVNITLPCVTIYNMQRPFDTQVLVNFLLTLVLTAVFILAALFGTMFLFRSRPHAKLAVLANLQGFSNCGFMGYPIILAVNPDWMIYAVAYNIAFIFISWTVGVSLYAGKENMSVKRALLNPNVISSVIGFALFCLNVTLPDILGQTLSLVGGLTTPLSMLLIGTRLVGLRPREFADPDYHITSALRLIVQPLLVFAILRMLPIAHEVSATIFLLTAMPCGTLTVMQAELYGGDTKFAAKVVAYSTLVALVTVPVMSFLL